VIAKRRPQVAEQSGSQEFDELAVKIRVALGPGHSQLHERRCTRCGEDMWVRLFERATFPTAPKALNVMCGWWSEP
jgi:hypothetical protein